MEIFSKDLLLGDFRISDLGLMVASFDYKGESEDEINITPSAIEKFIGYNPVPVYLGQKYENKLSPTVTLIKNPCIYNGSNYFTEKELRSILRVITGTKGYQWMKVINHEIDEDIWYKAKVLNVSYKRVGGNIVGIILEMMCDSPFAWSNKNEIVINAKQDKKFCIFNNTDDLNNYVLPFVEITSSTTGNISIVNLSDNSWTTEIKNMKANETVIIDSKRGIVLSNINHNLLLNDTNLHWFRLIPDKNEYVSNTDITIKFRFRVPRKVGFTE